ncbi:M13-type metalloendopeptidase [Lacticaseibacillus absianus]|uniref:M13-type metalloendopeptidase n=1 Tax=Lacticaseibacillus absianus TaxID=2729623 RepID=UPI001FE8F5A4|nr:M13 family metallopeptidase [Lacticaseibacillus absianus]
MTRPQDDLYDNVNGEWAATATIAPDKAATGGFADLRDGVEDQMRADLAAMAAGTHVTPAELTDAITYYRKATDFAARNAAGIAPALVHLTPLTTITTLAEFNAQAAHWDHAGFALPFSLSVGPDMKDTAHNMVRLAGPSTILPDRTYYEDPHKGGAQLLAVWRDMAEALLAQTSLSATDQAQVLADTLTFDAAVARHVKSRLEWADRVKSYNPQPLSEVAAQCGDFALVDYLEAVLPTVPETVNVADPGFLAAFRTLLTESSFTRFAHWAYLRTLITMTPYLSDDLRRLGDQFDQARSGNPEAPAPAVAAYRLTNAYYSESIGVYYGQTYFGAAAKADVTTLVEQMIATYKRRLADSNWLSAPTKAKAIHKLSTMRLNMGYPEHVHPLYANQPIDAETDLLTASLAIQRYRRDYAYAQLTRPVDRTIWAMPGHLVNACYRSSWNDITFPAAILQAPFYALTQTPSQNLGGIGAVIAHEISHGFDNNGAQFDAQGNLNNWWQPEDYAHFRALTQAMIAQFDGQPTPAGPINGQLCVSENIADAGGLAAALDTCKQLPEYDLKAFFTNWARIWRQKSRPETLRLRLATDVHAPHPQRANLQPQNLADWYTTFDVRPGDGMYRAPEDRITIW